jgi:hypothetical protein
MMAHLRLEDQIAEAAPTRQRLGDTPAEYAEALEADLRTLIEGRGAFR